MGLAVAKKDPTMVSKLDYITYSNSDRYRRFNKCDILKGYNMHKVVKLSVHKNNKAQRFKKDLRMLARKSMKSAVSDQNIAGYAIVTWTSDLQMTTTYMVGDDSPFTAINMPDIVQSALKRRVSE